MESQDEEWKRAWKSEYLKTICAFYNSTGGRMIIGKDDDGTVVGVSDPRRLLKEIPDTINNSLGISATVTAEEIDGKTCIIIKVPKGRHFVDYDGRYYGRCGSTTHLIRGDALKKIIIEDGRGKFWMDLPCDLKVSSISKEAVSYFVTKGKEAKRISSAINEKDVNAVLQRFDMILKDKKITYAAAFMFSQNPRKVNNGAFLKIGEFNSKGILLREDYVEEPFVMIPDKALSILYDKYIPPIFDYVGASRILSYKYPVEAVRELIVNAICHKNYMHREPITVSVYPDRIEIYCFGGLPEGWTEKTLKGKHSSVRRNETLAEVFHEAGFVENWAQGIGKVMDECKKNGNPEPRFSQYLNGLEATLYEKRNKKTNEILANIKPTRAKTQDTILSLIANDPTISAMAMAQSIGIAKRTVYYNLAKLTDAGKIRREGSDKRGLWIIVDDKTD